MLFLLLACTPPPPPPAALASAEAPQRWQLGPDLAVEVMAPGVWRHVSWQTLDSGLRYPSNGLVVRHEGRLLLVDTAWGEASTAALLDWVEQTLEAPVDAGVATHWHDDRMGGAGTLAERGVPLYAHAMTTQIAAEKGLLLPEPLGPLAPGAALDWMGLELFYPGPGHSVDNTMLWLPAQGILVGGCAVRSGQTQSIGNTADADLSEWGASLERAKDRYPQTRSLLPGHGDPGDLGLLTHTQGLVAGALSSEVE